MHGCSFYGCFSFSSQSDRGREHTRMSFLFAINTGVQLCVDDVAHDVSLVPVLNCELLESPELHTDHQLLSPL